MVQGDNPLEVNSKSKLEEDIDMSYDELATFCQKLLEKYDSILKEKYSFQNKIECISYENEFLKKENISLASKLNDICEGKNL